MNEPCTDFDLSTMLRDLQHDGVVVLPGLLADAVDELTRQHAMVFDPAQPMSANAVHQDGEQIIATSPNTLRAHGCDRLADALSPAWFSTLGQHYFNAPEPMDVLFLSLALDREKVNPDGPGNQHAHWDPCLSLRLMLYVTDVALENGAIEIIRGTHYVNHRQRLLEWSAGTAYSERPKCAGLNAGFEVVEAPAGSVLVFDTSITHRRGLLESGRQRRVGFGHIQSELGQHQLAGIPFDEISPRHLYPHLAETAPETGPT